VEGPWQSVAVLVLTVGRNTGIILLMPDDERYSLTELADLAGVTPRTVRYYLAQGLLPAVGQMGPGSRYDAGHLARLQLVRRLQAEHLPLAEIRRRLETLSDDEVRDLVGATEPAPPVDTALEYLRTVLGAPLASRAGTPHGLPPAPAASLQGVAERSVVAPVLMRANRTLSEAPIEPDEATTRPSDRSQWERIVLVPDIELHIRRPLPRAQNKQVDRLVTIARELLEEDRS
jgi:DNA-binding transcriptional MerR regulator